MVGALLLFIAVVAEDGAGPVACGTGGERSMRSSDHPQPRAGDVAIRQELETARQAGSVDAYDLFLSRHPNHPLAGQARSERDKVAARIVDTLIDRHPDRR